MKRIAPFIVISVLGGFSAALMVALWQLPPAAVSLPPQVTAHLAQSGVAHPVTAVLLNFRGYDTLLEIAVLLLAVIGLLAVGRTPPGRGLPAEPVVRALARGAAPLMVLFAVYLLWAGAHRPGGAFQAGALLAAALVLLNLAQVIPAWVTPSRLLRFGMVAGLLLFVLVALVLSGPDALLRYPPQQAGHIILLIESALTVSLGLILAGLFLLLSHTEGDA